MHSHLVRHPIPVDHDMPYLKDGAMSPEMLAKAFLDPDEKLLAGIMLFAAHDNENQELQWAGVNAAYIDKCASAWWALEVCQSWFWFLKVFWFPRSFVLWRVGHAMDRLRDKGLIEELIEWDLIESDVIDGMDLENGSNQNMPVYYPTEDFIHQLNDAVI